MASHEPRTLAGVEPITPEAGRSAGAAATWLAVVNPAAGRGRVRRRWPALAAALESARVPHRVLVTREAGGAIEAVRDAARAGTRRFLAVGGDGTLHEVVNGIMRSGARCTLAAAPLGTGNDWARGLGMPRAPTALAALLGRGRTVALDVGTIEYATPAGPARRWFVNVAGCGYDAFVVERLPERGPRPLAYLVALLRGLGRFAAPRLEVRGPGLALDGEFLAAFAMIGRYCGGGMPFAPTADAGDGLFDVVAVRRVGILAVLGALPRLYRGHVLEDPAVLHARVPGLVVRADPPTGVEADGQWLGLTPMRLATVPAAIDVVIP